MEIRQIELPLVTAKRWYKQGGELKEMALGAFSEKELIGDGLPKTWDEYCAKHGDMGVIIKASLGTAYVALNKHVFSDDKQAQAYIAKMKLHLLRDEYRQGWKPDWTDETREKYAIYEFDGEFVVRTNASARRFLSFQDEKRAKEFFECFSGLIKMAGDLI